MTSRYGHVFFILLALCRWIRRWTADFPQKGSVNVAFWCFFCQSEQRIELPMISGVTQSWLGYCRNTLLPCINWQRSSISFLGVNPPIELSTYYNLHMDGLMLQKRNFSALAMELRLSCATPTTWPLQERWRHNYPDAMSPLPKSLVPCLDSLKCGWRCDLDKPSSKPTVAILSWLSELQMTSPSSAAFATHLFFFIFRFRFRF